MYLAIASNVNAVFKLRKPDIATIKQYLSEIPHETFRTKEEAYKYININNIPKGKHFQFQECVRTLKAMNIIPKEENITAFSRIENIEDDEERRQAYKQRGLEIKLKRELKKARRVVEDNHSDTLKKYYYTYFAIKVPDISPIYNEIEIGNEIIESDLFTGDMRQSLLEYVRANGNKKAIGVFRGKVVKITHNAVLFEKLVLTFENLNGNFETKAETHIWMPDCEAFRSIGVQEGNCVQFKAIAYFYQRQNGSIDISLRAPHLIKLVKKYHLPK
jgi:hypothetical protein